MAKPQDTTYEAYKQYGEGQGFESWLQNCVIAAEQRSAELEAKVGRMNKFQQQAASQFLEQTEAWQAEKTKLAKRIAELEAERNALSKAAITLIKWIDHTVPSWTPEVEKYKNKLEALAGKPATKLQSIAKEAPATKNPRAGVCGNHCEWWLVRDGKCALGYSSWQACKEAAGKGE